MKKPYQHPALEILPFETEDVITTSGNTNTPGSQNGVSTLIG